jgi:tetratricopeptide (TPR) repeat protein
MNRATIDELRRQLTRADELLEQRRFPDACAVLRDAIEQADDAGVNSAMLMTAYSFALEGMHEIEQAYDWVHRATLRDPLHGSIISRLKSCLDALRALHEAHGTAPEVRRRIYERLLRAGEATVNSHLVMSRLARGERNLEEAQRLVDALLLLEPSNPEVWKERARLAELRQDADVVKESLARADALADVPPPWGIATPTAEC